MCKTDCRGGTKEGVRLGVRSGRLGSGETERLESNRAEPGNCVRQRADRGVGPQKRRPQAVVRGMVWGRKTRGTNMTWREDTELRCVGDIQAALLTTCQWDSSMGHTRTQ